MEKAYGRGLDARLVPQLQELWRPRRIMRPYLFLRVLLLVLVPSAGRCSLRNNVHTQINLVHLLWDYPFGVHALHAQRG